MTNLNNSSSSGGGGSGSTQRLSPELPRTPRRPHPNTNPDTIRKQNDHLHAYQRNPPPPILPRIPQHQPQQELDNGNVEHRQRRPRNHQLPARRGVAALELEQQHRRQHDRYDGAQRGAAEQAFGGVRRRAGLSGVELGEGEDCQREPGDQGRDDVERFGEALEPLEDLERAGIEGVVHFCVFRIVSCARVRGMAWHVEVSKGKGLGWAGLSCHLHVRFRFLDFSRMALGAERGGAGAGAGAAPPDMDRLGGRTGGLEDSFPTCVVV